MAIVPACPTSTGCQWPQLIQLINNIISFLLFNVSVPLATISFIWAGFLYMSSAGDTGKIAAAHEIFRKVIIGMVIAFAAWLLVHFIVTTLGATTSVGI